MADIFVDVDTSVVVPMNIAPIMQSDGLTIEQALVYNFAGLAVQWNFVTCAGVMTTVAITPTTAGVYDIAEPLANVGMYSIEIPASAGASANNDTEGFGWISGSATALLPWRGPIIGFRAAALNDALIDGGDTLDVNVTSQANIDFGALQKASLDAATPASVQNIPVDGSFDVNTKTMSNIDFTTLQKTYAETRTLLSADYVVTTDTIAAVTTIPAVTLANGAHGGAAATITLLTPIAATVPDNQKVDVNTLKTQALTVGAAVTINPSVGAASIQPTVTEFNARSLVSADYVVVGDTIAAVTAATVTAIGANVITAASIAAGAIDNATFAADVGSTAAATNIISQAVDKAITANTLILDVPSTAEFNARTLAAADYTIVADLGTVQTGDVFAALPTNFSALSISLTTGLVDITQTAADKVWGTAARVLTAGTNIALAKGTGVTGFNDLDAAGIAAATWNAATITYGSAGSYGLLIETNLDAPVSGATAPTAAAVADAVWDELVTGHDGAGKAGAQLWTALDAVLVDTAVIGALGAGLTAIPWNAAWDAEVQSECDDAITANAIILDLPTTAEFNARTIASADYLVEGDTLAAVTLVTTCTTNSDMVTEPPTAIENADALLKRDWDGMTGEAARSALNALRFLRNKWTVAGTALSVKKEDDSTQAWAGTVTTDPAAEPITGNDPT